MKTRTRFYCVALLGLCGLILPAPGAAQTPTPETAPTRDAPSFTPFTVAPRLLNQEEATQSLIDAYPEELRREGIGGRVVVWFFLTDEGIVDNTLMSQSSGVSELDEAALSAASVFRFSPAMNRENRTPVWIALPLTFEPREPR